MTDTLGAREAKERKEERRGVDMGTTPDARHSALHRYGILDTPREASLDDIVTTAALLCKTPIAAINFIDDHRQWTKAASGIAALDMPLDRSICAHTIRPANSFLCRGAAVKSLQEARQRVTGIAAVHEQLYRTSETDTVNMQVFLAGLCRSLAANKPDNAGAVTLCTDPVNVYSNYGMQIGLVVTELIGNGFKHALPAWRKGDIHVSLTEAGDRIRLKVSDEGIGLPSGFCTEDKKGPGMRLIRSVLGQMEASLQTESSHHGAHFIIDMPSVLIARGENVIAKSAIR